jgi:hypothetical protein
MVDVITNSSTEIFVSNYKGTIEQVKSLINYILECSGSNKKADDLFEFKCIDWRENIDEESYTEWGDTKEEVLESMENNGYRSNDDSLELIPKDKSKQTKDLIKIIRKMFYFEEWDRC